MLHRPFTHRADALEAAGLADGEQLAHGDRDDRARAWTPGTGTTSIGVVQMIEPDAEFVPIEQSIMPRFTGPEGMREFFNASTEVWEEFVFTPVAFVPDR